jgi:hypothetical protein
MWLAVAVGWCVYFGGLGAYAAHAKGRNPVEGVTLGILAGPLGVMMVASFPHSHRESEVEDPAEHKVDADQWDMHEVYQMPVVKP